jgi:thioredoxin 1
MTEHCALINNERDFDRILKVKDKLIVLFYATWCPFCIRFLPVFEKYANRMPQNYLLAEDNREILADIYAIEVIPTIIFFEDSKVSQRLDGILGFGLTEKQLTEFMHRCGFI